MNTPENNMFENETKHINLDYLKGLARGDNSFILEMINTFLDQTPEALSNLKTSLANKNWVLLRGIAHKMKPSVTFMGIKELESVLAEIENYAAKEISLELLPILINQLNTVCTEAIKELEAEKKNFL